MCMSLLPACMYVHHMYTWYPQKQKITTDPQDGSGIQIQVGPLQEHQVFLTAVISLAQAYTVKKLALTYSLTLNSLPAMCQTLY